MTTQEPQALPVSIATLLESVGEPRSPGETNVLTVMQGVASQATDALHRAEQYGTYTQEHAYWQQWFTVYMGKLDAYAYAIKTLRGEKKNMNPFK